MPRTSLESTGRRFSGDRCRDAVPQEWFSRDFYPRFLTKAAEERVILLAETKVMGLAGVALCRAMPHTDIVSRRGLTLAAAIARQRLDRALRTVLKVSKKDQLKEDAMPKDVNREKARRTEVKRPS